jgi:hypothetical protein
MATDRLKIYNGALLICGERAIAALTDNNAPRRALDEVWNDGGVRYCIEQAQWKFAMCASKFTYDTSITPTWGYRRAFAKPSDWVLTSAVCTDEYFRSPLTQYSDEVGFWFADQDDLYILRFRRVHLWKNSGAVTSPRNTSRRLRQPDRCDATANEGRRKTTWNQERLHRASPVA